ncbi:MAG: hypothetical protein R3C24_07505 [Cyanobacteriota/Melainabacteria group bacterium]
MKSAKLSVTMLAFIALAASAQAPACSAESKQRRDRQLLGQQENLQLFDFG